MTNLKAGGVDMPPKTDMNDMTTPSGAVPVFIAPGMWPVFESHGYDMRWFAASPMMPVSSKLDLMFVGPAVWKDLMAEGRPSVYLLHKAGWDAGYTVNGVMPDSGHNLG